MNSLMPFYAVFLLTFSIHQATASDVQTGRISIDECTSNFDPFREDHCRLYKRSPDLKCRISFSVQNGAARSLEISSDAWFQEMKIDKRQIADIANFYEADGATGTSRHQLHLSGDQLGGDLILKLQEKGHPPEAIRVDIFVNHDRKGSKYTRYRCEF